MDSGNSGSMQSSSGGDEEYDSRAETISSFLNPSLHFGSSSNPNPPTFFDPSSHNLDSFSHSPNTNPLYNLDLVWSRNLRSDPNYSDYPSLTGSSSTPSLLGGAAAAQGPFPTLTVDGNTSRAPPPPPPQSSEQTNAVKNPKKRTRASRRAPTTVLTTDTANFRQMVQEFTGIPAAPFSSSSSPYSRRLDLFGAGSSAMRSSHLDTLGPLYPLRPQVQKVQLTPYVPSSSSSPSFMVDAITSSNNTIAGTSHNYQHPSDLSLSKHPQNMLNNENPILTFSLLGSSRIPSMAELGMSQDHVNANLTRWGDGGGRENLGSFGGNNGNSQYKFDTSSASASDFHHEKGLENVSSRGEGTVDSWICPSD